MLQLAIAAYPRLALGALAAMAMACGISAGVSSAEYEDWPLTIGNGVLHCWKDDGYRYVTFNTGDEIEYALQPEARAHGFRDSQPIRKPGKTEDDLQPLVERGKELCP